MKAALCLSGQLRFLETCYYESMKPNILDTLRPDVFVHTWDPNDHVGKFFINSGGHTMGSPVQGGLVDKMVELYNPKKYVVEPQKEFEFGKWSDRTMPGIRSDYLYSMFYSGYKANQLRVEHEQEVGQLYDWVIRARFDIALPSGPLQLDALDNQALYVLQGCFDNQRGYLDSFAYSNSKIMNTYADLFNQIDTIMNTTDIRFCGEYLLRSHIDANNIPVIERGAHKLYR